MAREKQIPLSSVHGGSRVFMPSEWNQVAMVYVHPTCHQLMPSMLQSLWTIRGASDPGSVLVYEVSGCTDRWLVLQTVSAAVSDPGQLRCLQSALCISSCPSQEPRNADQILVNAGPTSKTVGQHSTNIGSPSHVCWYWLPAYHPHLVHLIHIILCSFSFDIAHQLVLRRTDVNDVRPT